MLKLSLPAGYGKVGYKFGSDLPKPLFILFQAINFGIN